MLNPANTPARSHEPTTKQKSAPNAEQQKHYKTSLKEDAQKKMTGQSFASNDGGV